MSAIGKRVVVDPVTGCWNWTAALSPDGYGLVNITGNANVRRAHRMAYELFVGRVREGLEIDHLCRNRACCNPDHLEAVTHAENVRRSYIAMYGSTPEGDLCRRGHVKAGENLYVYVCRDGRTLRVCRECKRATEAAKRRAKREVSTLGGAA